MNKVIKIFNGLFKHKRSIIKDLSLKNSIYTYISNRDLAGAKNLLQHGHDPNELDEYGSTPLFRIVYNNHENELVNFLSLLIEFKADVNARRSDGATPVFYANKKAAEILIKAGADLTMKNHSNATPLHTVTDVETADLFIKNGIRITDIDNLLQTPLHIYAWHENTLVDLAIKNGADVNAKDENFRTPFINLAMTNGFNNEDLIDIIKSAELLYNAGADLKACDIKGLDALYYAASFKNDKLVAWIKQKTDIV